MNQEQIEKYIRKHINAFLQTIPEEHKKIEHDILNKEMQNVIVNITQNKQLIKQIVNILTKSFLNDDEQANDVKLILTKIMKMSLTK